MQWIFAIEAENDPIVPCRLLNILRRKGVSINAMTLSARTENLSLMAVVDSPEEGIEHIFNFLRRMEGIHHVTYYRSGFSEDASFIFIEAHEDAEAAKILAAFPQSQWVFASHGKYLVEIEPGGSVFHGESGSHAAGFLPFVRVKASHSLPRDAAPGEIPGRD